MNRSPSLYVLFVAAALIVGAALGYAYGHRAISSSSQVLRENSSEYKFTNPLLLSQNNASVRASEYEGTHDDVASYIKKAENAGNAADVSVYIRNMNSGLWTGINEDDTYAPGSMLKVAIMMGYLSKAEDAPSLLDEKYYYNPEVDEGQYFKPAKTLAQGSYSIRDLIKNMIVESDNTATLILANAHPDIITQVYKNLALPDPVVGSDFMSPKQYASFWRVLYNGTYLSHDVSEESLDLLSLTTFKDGLVAGLPQGIRIAHKFGEHTDVVLGVAPVHELHDCGIVYPAGVDPYFVCVMTRGSDFQPLETIISDISKIVYAKLSK